MVEFMKKLFLMIMLSLPFIVACSDDDNEMKVDLNNAVLQFIDSRYQGAKLRSSEFESNGLLEVEILHDARIKDVLFNSADEWVATSWDVSMMELSNVSAGPFSTKGTARRTDMMVSRIISPQRYYFFWIMTCA